MGVIHELFDSVRVGLDVVTGGDDWRHRAGETEFVEETLCLRLRHYITVCFRRRSL